MSRFARKLEGVSIIEALREPMLLGASLIGDIESWSAWLVFLTGFFGLTLSNSDLALYRQCTGRTVPPGAPFSTVYLIAGRGSGKSFILSLISVYLATFKDWTSKLAPGGKPIVLLIAPTREQAKIDLSYIVGILDGSPVLRRLVTNITANSVELKTGVTIETGVADFRSIRGRSICCAIIDEAAFLRSDTTTAEVLAAVMPSLGRFGHDGVLLIGSTPYSRKGVLYDGWREYHGQDCPEVLSWQAPTRVMNPSYSQALIDREIAKDPAKNRSEYLAVWREDLEDYLSRDALETCIVPSMRERSPRAEFRYVSFVDPAGGASGAAADAYTIAVAHKDGDSVVLDCIRERRGSPEAITAEYAALLRTYRIARVTGDDYGAQWVKESFSRHGITYESSRLSRVEIYLNFLPLVHSRRAELLDGAPRMMNQLLALERTTGPSGRDTVKHPAGAHDDVANAVAGAIVLASAYTAPMTWHVPIVGPSKALHAAEHAHGILADRSSGVPGIASTAYGDCSCPPGGWPADHPMAPGASVTSGGFAHLGWSINKRS